MPAQPAHSTLLENLQLGDDGARLQLEGRPIELHGDPSDPAVGALSSFYQSALADYRGRGRAAGRPGLLQRVRGWLARLFGVGPAAPASAAPPAAEAAAAVPARMPAAAAPAAARPPAPTPSIPAGAPPPPAPAAAAAPQLRSAYADRAGVHVIWQPAGGREAGSKIEFLYDFDSAAAQRLEECYGQLSKLGYPVVGLGFLRAELSPAPTGAGPQAEAPPERPAPAPPETAAPAKPLAAEEAGRAAAADKKERTFVMRLHPASPDEPNRALVAPVENRENIQVLVAPERLVRALYAAAAGTQPPDQRVTYLRCRPGKSGLKVVDVGVGEGRDQGPARWDEVAAWWEAAQKAPAPEAKKARPAPEAGPIPAPELGLF